MLFINRQNLQSFIAATLFLLTTTHSYALSKANKSKQVLHCGHMIDVKKGVTLKSASVFIENDKIKKIKKGFTTEKNFEVIDLKEQTCLPGLIDVHVHFEQQFPEMSLLYHPDEARMLIDSISFPEKTLMAGFTTVRDLASLRNITTNLKRGIKKGELIGPRIINAGIPVSATNGHIDPLPKLKKTKIRPNVQKDYQNYYEYKFVDRVEDVAPWFHHHFVRRPSWYKTFPSVDDNDKSLYFDAIKIAATGGVISENPNSHRAQLSEKVIAAVVKEAQRYGKKLNKPISVAAHAHGLDGIANAVFGGVNTVEHGTELLSDIDKITDPKKIKARELLRAKIIKTMKEKSIFLSPTLLTGVTLAKMIDKGQIPPHIAKKEKRVSAGMYKSFRKAVKAGVPIVLGSDTGISLHGDNAQELVEMVKYSDMTPMQALQTGTINAAKSLKLDKQIGSLESGKQADIIAINGRPDLKIETVSDVNFVMLGGQIYKIKGKKLSIK